MEYFDFLPPFSEYRQGLTNPLDGMKRIDFYSSGMIWNENKNSWNDFDWFYFKNQIRNNNDLMVLNLEQEDPDFENHYIWLLDSRKNDDELVKRYKQNLQSILAYSKSYHNGKVSIYSTPILQGFWPVTEYSRSPNITTFDKYVKWLRAIDKIKNIEKYLDCFTPSFYIAYQSKTLEYKEYFNQCLDILQEYNKPVYPFIWCKLHNTNTYLNKENCMMLKDVITSRCEGAIFFDTRKTQDNIYTNPLLLNTFGIL